MSQVQRYRNRLIVAVIAILMLGQATAQDLDPRRYTNIPVGQNFLALAFVYSEGDVNFSSSIPLSDAKIRIDGPALAYLRTFAIAGKSASVDVLLPYACVAGSAVLDGERASRDVCGLGDTALRVSYNFFGAPAAELRDFVRQKKTTVVGASVQVGMPTGQYDSDKLLNIGANRWYIKPEIGVTVPWNKWSFEFSAGVRLFTDNSEFVGDANVAQDPLYNIQSHLIYDLSPRQWVSMDGNYFFGGDTSVDGVPSESRQNNSRLGLTWTLALNSKHLLKFHAHTGVIGRISNDSDNFTVAWSYRWD
jgi:hypothetical protein